MEILENTDKTDFKYNNLTIDDILIKLTIIDININNKLKHINASDYILFEYPF